MMVTIKDYFIKMGCFGFTGTPLFDENNITGMIDEKVNSLIQQKSFSGHYYINIRLTKRLRIKCLRFSRGLYQHR